MAWFTGNIFCASLDKVKETCKSISGMAHHYSIVNVSKNRVQIEYSNPDEYGYENPMTIIYPCFQEGDMIIVVFWALRVINDTWDGEGWQAFDIIKSAIKEKYTNK